MRAIYILIAVYTAAFSFICAQKYFAFGYHGWDLALYSNILWNIAHGKVYASMIWKIFLLDHASLIAFVVAIPYAVFQHPIFLLVLQSFAIGISALPV
jgi:uncharacterized membrane protein